ncbi:hypothetical protein QFZ84_000926 [Pseudomonas fluorescens]
MAIARVVMTRLPMRIPEVTNGQRGSLGTEFLLAVMQGGRSSKMIEHLLHAVDVLESLVLCARSYPDWVWMISKAGLSVRSID